MLQARPEGNGKQRKEQNSPNLAEAFQPSPLFGKSIVFFTIIIKGWPFSNLYTIMAIGDDLDDGKGRILYFSTPLDLGRGRGSFGDNQDDNRRKHIENR